MTATELEKKQKTAYAFQQILRSTNPHFKGVDFNTPLIGLGEMVRQYESLSSNIKNISGPSLLMDIKNTVSDYSWTKSDLIKDKFVREFAKEIKFFQTVPKESTLLKVSRRLKDSTTIKGFIRTLRDLIKNQNFHLDSNHLKIIDEIILLITEYLFEKGHSKQEIYKNIKSLQSKSSTPVDLFESVLKMLIENVSISIDSYPLEKITIFVRKNLVNKNNNFKIKSIIEKYFHTLKLESRAKKISIFDTFYDLNIEVMLYKIDQNYVEKILNLLNERLLEFASLGIIDLDHIEYTLGGSVHSLDFFNSDLISVKYMNKFLDKRSLVELSEYKNDEILKIVSSLSTLNLSKRQNFISLWSTLEFLLIEAAEDNKINTICANFPSYLVLFYYRKRLKTLYRDMSREIDRANRKASHETREMIDLNTFVEKCLTKENIDFENWDLISKFSKFIFINQSKFTNEWNELKIDEIEKNIFIAEIREIQVTKKSKLNQFEAMIKIDLKQMYRLRNTLTHSGINDLKILENTYYRLKYYVQTLLNSIFYNWENGTVESIQELHEIKRFECVLYKEFISHGNDIETLCHLKNLWTPVPKIKFNKTS